MDDRLYRSRDDRILTGVAGGVAERLDADPSIIRIVWALLIVLTGGLALLVYVVMAIVVPERPEGMAPIGPAGEAGEGQAMSPTTGGPVPEGSWLAPDGSTVPMGSMPPRRARRHRDPADRARAGLIGGVVLIGLGALFLLREFVPAFDFDLIWPAALIGLGVVLVVVAVAPSRRSG